MPIPGIKMASPDYIRLEIYEEVLRARINKNSRYSFLKREVLKDLGILFITTPSILESLAMELLAQPILFWRISQRMMLSWEQIFSINLI